jgi:glutathione S-transferase
MTRITPLVRGCISKSNAMKLGAERPNSASNAKFLSYFETIIVRNPAGSGLLVGQDITYVDLSMFQVIEGLRYAFPRLLQREARRYLKLIALHDRIQKEPRIADYLSSPRRVAFNEQGIFRHYEELDATLDS